MPKFNEDYYSKSKRALNDERDRSVPIEEDYYRQYDKNDPNNIIVRDNQKGYVDINALINSYDSNEIHESYRPIEPPRQAQNRQPSYNNYSAQPPRQNKPPQKKKRKAKAKIKLISILAIILIIGILPFGFLGSVMNQITYDDKRQNQYASTELANDKGIKNILFLGVDARAGEDADKSRSDSMMLISIDTKHKCIKTISFLRDTWVYIPCKDSNQRLNAACAYDGYNGVVDTIEYNFGVNIDGYVVADFSMFEAMVDGIGGVKVDVTEDEANEVTGHPKRYGDVVLEAGEQKLTGKQALAYCRIRKIDTDFVRAKRQRTVIQSIINGIKKKPYKVFSMANGCAKYIETDLTKSELIKIGFMSLKCISGKMVQDKVPFENTWEYANKNGQSVIAINVDKNKDKLIDFIYNKSAEEILTEQESE